VQSNIDEIGSTSEPAEERDPNFIEENQTMSQRKVYKKKSVFKEDGPLTIEELLYYYPTCPRQSFMKIKEFYNNRNLKDTLVHCKWAEKDLRNWCLKLSDWQLTDYINYYNDPKVKPYFNAYNRLREQVYFDISQSVAIANELLLYQFGDSENVHDFLNYLINILDRRVPKLNTLAIYGEPCSGKNYFFDAVAAFFL